MGCMYFSESCYKTDEHGSRVGRQLLVIVNIPPSSPRLGSATVMGGGDPGWFFVPTEEKK